MFESMKHPMLGPNMTDDDKGISPFGRSRWGRLEPLEPSIRGCNPKAREMEIPAERVREMASYGRRHS